MIIVFILPFWPVLMSQVSLCIPPKCILPLKPFPITICLCPSSQFHLVVFFFQKSSPPWPIGSGLGSLQFGGLVNLCASCFALISRFSDNSSFFSSSSQVEHLLTISRQLHNLIPLLSFIQDFLPLLIFQLSYFYYID